MVLEIDAGGFAALGAGRAVAALGFVEVNLQQREARDEAQEGADGTDGVAIGATAYPSQNGEDEEGYDSDDERRQAAHPHIHVVEGVAVVLRGDRGEAVVDPFVNRCEEVRGNASKATVGSQQGNERAYAGHEGDDEEDEYRVAQPFNLGRKAVASHLFILTRA